MYQIREITLRGRSYRGTLYRAEITFVAIEGDSTTITATDFVPQFEEWETWPLPADVYIGRQGCLERLRFAVDPEEDKFYFGTIS